MGVPSAQARDGWLPDSSWGPWYRYTDPTGSNSYGMAPVETRPGRVAVDDAGRFVVAGIRYDNTQGTACDANTDNWARVGDQHIVLSRYLPDGTLDTSFGTQGSLVVPESSHTVDLTDLVIAGNDVYVSAYRQTAQCGQPPAITTLSLPAGEVDTSYSAALAAKGGASPYRWAITGGALPDGLTLNATTGVISGVPSQSTMTSFTVTLVDANGDTVSRNFTLAISQPAPLTVTTSELPVGSTTSAYSTTLEATGGRLPYQWTITDGALPAGLLLDSQQGVVSGLATEYGSFTVNVQVTDRQGNTAQRSLTLDIEAPTVQVPTEVLARRPLQQAKRLVPPPSIVVKVTGEGSLDQSFGSEGIWEAQQTLEEVHLAQLGNQAVGAFFDNSFAFLSSAGAQETDLQDTVCSGREVVVPGEPLRDCPQGARLAAHGSTVAVTLAWGRKDNRTMRVFFGELRGRALLPDTRVSSTGVAVLDLTDVIGSRTVWPGSNWIGWDSQGRLLSMVTVVEPFPELVNPGSPSASIMDVPHGRGLLLARFIPDNQEGWILDGTYGRSGTTYLPLPVSGPDNFEVSAFGLTSDDQPVAVGQWWNFNADAGGQFALRLTSQGALDETYGTGGMSWLPPETPPIFGRPALDNKDNQYFGAAWRDFATRTRTKAPYQLGRLNTRGQVQVHDGRSWQTARQKSRPRLQLTLDGALPKTARSTKVMAITAHVSLPGSKHQKAAPASGVLVSAVRVGPGGYSDRTTISSARTDARGIAHLKVRIQTTGYYCFTAVARNYVATGSRMVPVQVI